ncbi:MAG: hypothetical protein HQK72_06515 [Desulfamplus sp.]|nr:hypothetical protein [Desulfamplus sp.]
MLNNMMIDELIKCPKNIVDAIPKHGMAIDKKNSFVKRKNLTLKSTDDKHIFEMFLRQNTMFIEDFSIGLMFKTEDKSVGKITLIRYNGEHGQSDWSRDNHYSAFHIHKITEKLLIEGIYEPKDIQITNKFSTFDSALTQFLHYVNVKNFDKYFPHYDKQMYLFEGQ